MLTNRTNYLSGLKLHKQVVSRTPRSSTPAAGPGARIHTSSLQHQAFHTDIIHLHMIRSNMYPYSYYPYNTPVEINKHTSKGMPFKPVNTTHPFKHA